MRRARLTILDMMSLGWRARSAVLLALAGLASCADPRYCDEGDPECKVEKRLCGNGVIDSALGELCDGETFGENSCASFGFASGKLACSATCREISTKACSTLPAAADASCAGDMDGSCE